MRAASHTCSLAKLTHSSRIQGVAAEDADFVARLAGAEDAPWPAVRAAMRAIAEERAEQ
jgi:hypothetical protein